jgi:hypothetical protein
MTSTPGCISNLLSQITSILALHVAVMWMQSSGWSIFEVDVQNIS